MGAPTSIVVVSDLHAGCQLGLCPQLARRDFGGAYTRSPSQVVVWRWWEKFWGQFVPEATKGEPFAVVVNGDLIDGRHHRATSQVSQNLHIQRQLAQRILEPVADKAAGFFVVRGTPAHAGEASEDEETIAEWLGASPDNQGNHARNELWVRCGDSLVHAMHHIGTAGAPSGEATAIMGEMADEFTWAGRLGDQAPDVVVRSHRHCNIEVNGPTPRGRFYSFSTAGWQLKTPFVYRIKGGRIAPPQFGGSVIRHDGKKLNVEHFTKLVRRPKPVEL